MLQGKIALVTGSTQGIGRSIAEQLAKAGCKIVMHGLEETTLGNLAAEKLEKQYGVSVRYVQADLQDVEETASLLEQSERSLGPINILVNNAGIQYVSPVGDLPTAKWNAVVAVNLTAPFILMRAVIPGFRSRGWGRIINIASVHGIVGSVNKTAYLASKHGLVGLTKGVALETAAERITANCICPGFTTSPLLEAQIMSRAQKFGGARELGLNDLLSEKQPSLVLVAPEAIGSAVVFLCGESAASITGVAMPIDGGWTAQ
jgi:3-hydroxybutyrate dehydrogenase